MKRATLASATSAAAKPATTSEGRKASPDRKMLMYRADPAVAMQLKMMAVEEETTVQALFAEAVNDLFEKRGKPTLA